MQMQTTWSFISLELLKRGHFQQPFFWVKALPTLCGPQTCLRARIPWQIPSH